MEKKIYLYFDNLCLSELTETDKGYNLVVDEENLKTAISMGCPPIIRAGLYDSIPYCFYDLEFSPHRQDLREKYGIQRGDSRFERLFKKALKNEPKSNDFWIGTEIL